MNLCPFWPCETCKLNIHQEMKTKAIEQSPAKKFGKIYIYLYIYTHTHIHTYIGNKEKINLWWNNCFCCYFLLLLQKCSLSPPLSCPYSKVPCCCADERSSLFKISCRALHSIEALKAHGKYNILLTLDGRR